MDYKGLSVRLLSCFVVLISAYSCALKSNNTSKAKSVQIGQINYNGWSNAIELKNDSVRLVVVPEVGRILHYGYIHQDNLLYVNHELEGIQLREGKAYVENDKKTAPNIGGDRLLVNSEPYYEQVTGLWNLSDYWINASPYTFEILSNGVVLESPVSRLQGVKVKRVIKLAPSGSKVTIEQSVHKIAQAEKASVDSIPLTLWSLTKIRPPKSSFLPLDPNSVFKEGYMVPDWKDAENLAANNVIVENNLLKLMPIEQGSQKVGADATGWVAGLIDDVLMIERFPVVQNANYPDGGTSATLFSNKDFTELECLSPEKVLSIGDSLCHTITWELHEIDNDNVMDYLRTH